MENIFAMRTLFRKKLSDNKTENDIMKSNRINLVISRRNRATKYGCHGLICPPALYVPEVLVPTKPARFKKNNIHFD